jgi:tRNA (guanine-N7-)-methyltransferase
VIELVPETYFAPLDLFAIFGRIAPLHVDLGCGDGAFLSELAQSHPDQSFLGIEKLVGRVAKASRKAAALENVRILKVESSYAVRYLLPENSVSVFYLLFPDPWPKRRHQRRRIVTTDFLDSIHHALQPDGLLHVATDQLDYFQQIQHLAQAAAAERSLKLDRLNRSSFRFEFIERENVDLPQTKFERRFREQDTPIYRLTLRKISPFK